MKQCPRCGAKEFFVSAHVVQDWVVDENGTFLEIIDDCIEVTHYPDDTDIWDCAECGYSDRGSAFNSDNNKSGDGKFSETNNRKV